MPRCTASCWVNVVPSSHALSAPNSRSVSTAQRATTGRYVVPIWRRRRSTPDMSHSTIVVQWAASSSERFMCSPIDWRMRESGSPAAAGVGAGARGRGRRHLGIGPVRALDVQRRLGRRLTVAGLEEGQDVLLAHATAAARALHL